MLVPPRVPRRAAARANASGPARTCATTHDAGPARAGRALGRARGEGRGDRQRDAHGSPSPGRAAARRGDRSRGDRGEGADDAGLGRHAPRRDHRPARPDRRAVARRRQRPHPGPARPLRAAARRRPAALRRRRRLAQPAAGAAARSRPGRGDQGRRVGAVRTGRARRDHQPGVAAAAGRPRPRRSSTSRRRRASTARSGRRPRPSTAGAGRCSPASTASARQDLDDDGWSDLPAFARAVVRPRFRVESDTGAALFVTGGAIVEQRDGGTEPGALAPDGAPFAQDLDTFRADVGRRRALGLGPAAVRRARRLLTQRPAPHLRRRRGARHPAHRVRRGHHDAAGGPAHAGRRRRAAAGSLHLAGPATLRLRLHGARGVRAGRDHAGLAGRDLGQRARGRAQRVRHAGEPARLGAAQAVRGVDGAPVDRRRGVRADAVHRGDRRQRAVAARAAHRARRGAGAHGIGRRDVDARPVRDQRHRLRIDRRRRRAARDAGAARRRRRARLSRRPGQRARARAHLGDRVPRALPARPAAG